MPVLWKNCCRLGFSVFFSSIRKIIFTFALHKTDYRMGYTDRFRQSEDFRREELIRVIERSVEKLTVQELEALYYDMSTKNYINDSL